MFKNLVCLLIILLLLSSPAFAEGQGTGNKKTCGSDFFVTIVGTRNFEDVRFIKETLEKFSSICSVTPYSEANKTVTLIGTFSGNSDAIIEDLKGIIIDRFELKAVEKQPTLKISLLKLGI